ncbi:primosomal protein N' [Pseudodesulfovibrio cashew]|uniref:Replication restart protein PriA n=1 Tax=Pseudodesulfovibrio cashew TaxID=2678688 RepID=A0A6I6JEV4_9BACT|nr:primosomal protein N' [Pseudodesulfovibrio cashew]QGY40691.1 primosomal protein N' [Pseudodesulfovibrio cashew]
MGDLWQVTLVSPPYTVLTYERPSHFPAMTPGLRVIVPLGRSHRMGVVVGPAREAPSGVEIKPLIWPLELTPILDEDYLDVADNLASRQMASVGRILEILLPRGLRTAAVTFRVDRHVAGRDLPGMVRPSELSRFSPKDLSALMELWLAGRMRVRVNAKREAEERFVSLVSDPPWAVRPNAKRQLRILEHLLDNGPQSLFALKHSLGEWAPDTAAKMEGRGLVALGELTADRLAEVDEGPGRCGEAEPPTYDLTPEQRQTLAELSATMDNGGGAHLVHGVTGSGKTVLYLEMIRASLERGRSVILLAPEVALACKLYRNVLTHFPGQRTIFYHGYQSPKKRERTFIGVAREQGPVIVVGTRSALFLPVRELGMVVMDEEHDESFKQEDRLAYHAKEVAWYRVERSGGLLVLGSATPDVKTFHAARNGAIPLSTLRERVGDAVLPEVKLVDIGSLSSGQAFAPETVKALRETVKAGGQAIVMLNRRGYAPLMYCLDCGETVRCPECEVGMTYHKGRERVVCHYCGLSYAYPLLCPKCGGSNYVPMGEGTERLEERLVEALPEGTGILRLDSDATRRQERMEEILSAFGRGEAQVLVGTQMISKGHHFPGVTLVIVADGDLGLNLPDYRSAERTFQLLVQVAGRAGRGDRPGRVLIQTRNPGHPIWNDVLSGDYPAFFEREIGRRKLFGYPPFSRLALIRISYPADCKNGPAALSAFKRVLEQYKGGLGVTVLGPAPAPLSMLRGRRRFNCLLKGGDWGALRTLFAHAAQANSDPKQVRISLDLDPLTTL